MGQADLIPSDLEWLASLQPQFPVRAENINVLLEPSDFFSTLKKLSGGAERRISIASLYIGTSELENELVDCFSKALCRPNLQLNVLLDYNRGSRGLANSRTILLPLIKEFPEQAKVALYYSPGLRGWLRHLLPERWNEVVNLCHLKIYVFDDTLVMSGANLSYDYFTERQDRYMVFRDCPALANFFHQLLTVVSSFSLQLDAKNDVSLHPSWNVHPFLGSQEKFIEEANRRVQNFMETSRLENVIPTSKPDQASSDTLVYPLIQMKRLGIMQDESATQAFFSKAPEGSNLKLASGYFNLTTPYMDALVNNCKANVDILTASPEANGFFGAKGMAGYIPAIYTCLEEQFFHRTKNTNNNERIRLHEYDRTNWTFHGKGIWYSSPSRNTPVLSFIGSPNFGYRSVYRDLEAQVIVLTSNQELQKKFLLEQQHLFQSSMMVTEATFQRKDRRISVLLRFVTSLVKSFF